MTRTMVFLVAAITATVVAGCYDPESTGPHQGPVADAGIVPTSDGGPVPTACESDPLTQDQDGDRWCPSGRDLDADGTCCDSGEALPADQGDCDDDQRGAGGISNPGVHEICGNGIDEDCGETPCATPSSCPDLDELDPDCDPSLNVCDADAVCADGSFCTVNVRCADHRCIAGIPRVCDDGNASTADTCNEAADRCDYVPLPSCTTDAACTDGLFCNGSERCVGGACVAGTTVSCNDGNDRTTDTCNEAGDRCNNVPISGCLSDAECGDGLFCNGSERCNGITGTCQAGTAPSCSFGCNEASDICNPAPAGCTSDAACSDGLHCNGAERCSSGSCVSGTAPSCDDGLSTTADSCNEFSDSCNHTIVIECTSGTSRSCTTSCGGDLGSQVCQADGRWPSACSPPAERCGNGRDDDCDVPSQADEGCAVSCTMTDFVTVRVGSPGTSAYRTSFNMEDRTCMREYRYVDDSVLPIEKIVESRDGLYMVQVQQTSSGQWFSYMETSTPFSPIFLRSAWGVTIQVNSATCSFPTIPSGGYTPPTTIGPNECIPCYDSAGNPNICVNTSSSTRELRCNDGVDNDADGRTDAADEDCGRWS